MALFAVAGAWIGADVAAAQGYPPPTNTPTPTPDPSQPPPSPTVTATPKINNCARTGVHRQKNKFTATNEFTPGSNIVVKGKAKCAKANAKVTIKLDGRKIGSGEASKNGSYTITGKIPKSTSFGAHTVTAVTGKKTYPTVIQVVPSSGKESSGFATTGPILAAWMVLAGVIAAFFVGSRRRREPALIVAVAPEAAVPFIDTSHFVPTNTWKPRRRRKPAAKNKPAAKKKSAPRTKGSASAKKTAKPSAKAKPAAKPKAVAKKPKAGTTKSTAKKPSAKGRATTKRTGAKSPTTKPGQRKDSRPKR